MSQRRRDRDRQGARSLHVRGYNVGNVGDRELRGVFEAFGQVVDVYLPRDYFTKDLRGFAYVQFANEADADEARRKLDRQDLFKDGREVHIMWAAGERKSPNDMRRIDVLRDNPHARRARMPQGDWPTPGGPGPRGRSRSPRKRPRSPSPRRGPYRDRERERSPYRPRDRRRRSRSPYRRRSRSPRRDRSPYRGRRDRSPRRRTPPPRSPRRGADSRSPPPRRGPDSPTRRPSPGRRADSRSPPPRRLSRSPPPKRRAGSRDREDDRSPPIRRRRSTSPDGGWRGGGARSDRERTPPIPRGPREDGNGVGHTEGPDFKDDANGVDGKQPKLRSAPMSPGRSELAGEAH